MIHEVTAGGNPYSLLAIVDAMNNHKPRYHNIEAVAVTPSKVVCLAISDLIKVCREYPPANLRLAQMIIIRLHRVTFAALHNFFGLDRELFSQVQYLGFSFHRCICSLFLLVLLSGTANFSQRLGC